MGLGPQGSPLFAAGTSLPSLSTLNDYRCSLPPPYRPLSREDAATLLPRELDGELHAVEERFFQDPSETNLLAFLSVLQSHDLDLRGLRDRLRVDCHQIMAGGALLTTPPKHPIAEDQRDAGIRRLLSGLEESRAKTIVGNSSFDASVYQPLERLLSNRFFAMIRRAHADPVRALMNEALALHLLGDDEGADPILRMALDRLDERANPPSREDLALRATLLHRLASVTDNYFEEKGEWIARAAEDIEALSRIAPNEALLLRSENLNLKLQAESGVIRQEIAAGLLDQDGAAAAYAIRIGRIHRDLVATDLAALETVHGQPERELLERDLANAQASLIEHEFGVAWTYRAMEEDEDCETHAALAREEMGALERFGQVLSPEIYRSLYARALLARAYYHFGAGLMEDRDSEIGALTDIETILKDYPGTMAARVIAAPESWTRRYGIVDDQGRPSTSLHKPGFIAGLLTAAKLLTDHQSGALVGCGIGAVVFAIGDIAFGEKVSGGTILAGCLAGTVAERAIHVLQNVDLIADSYRSGVSNVTPGEALMSLGQFALDLLSIYAGGRVGALFQRATLSGGAAVGRSVSGLLTRIGFTPGPWTRGIASILLRETGHVANAAGFQSGVLGVQAIAHPNAALSLSAGDFAGTWLFARFLPRLLRTPSEGFTFEGFGGRFRFEAEPGAIRALSGAAGVAGLEALYEIASGRDFRHYGERVFQGLFLLALASPRVPESPSPPPQTPRIDYSRLPPGQIVRIPLADITPSQSVVFSAQVEGYGRGLISPTLPEIRVIDGTPYVVDGHHRLFSLWRQGVATVEVRNYDPATDPDAHLTPTLAEKATRWEDMVVRRSEEILLPSGKRAILRPEAHPGFN